MSPIIRNYQESLLDNWLANSVRASLDRCKYTAYYWVHKSTYREVNDSSLGESIPTFFTASVAVEDGCIYSFCIISLPFARCHVVCLHIPKELIAPSNEWRLAPYISTFKSRTAWVDMYLLCLLDQALGL